MLRLLAGAGAGIVAMSATYPLDMVRGRLTVQEGKKGQYRGIIHAARVITTEVGFVLCHHSSMMSQCLMFGTS